MKQLRTSFQKNVDHCGMHNFTQIKRSDKAALYQRTRLDGTIHSFEVFKIKVVLKGAPLPNNKFVEEDYESYPGKYSFGKTAYSCKTLDQAEERYEELNGGDPVAPDSTPSEVDEAGSEPKPKISRKPIDRSKIKLPSKGDKFKMKNVAEMNPDISVSSLYNHIRDMVNNNQCKVAGKVIIAGHKKPTLLYELI